MTKRDECPSCGATLGEDERAEERCSHCDAELPPGDEDRPLTAEERSEEAFPASDPPAW